MSRDRVRHLVLVLGDQLDADASAFDGFDPAQDAVWMAEVAEESTHVPSSKMRTAFFLSAMRHFAEELRARDRRLFYVRLDDSGNRGSLAAELRTAIERERPQRLVMTAPGEWRVLQSLRAVAAGAGLPFEVREDRSFFATVREFSAHARGRRQLRMEYFYREMRRRHRVLMDRDDTTRPEGGQWNFDADNRESFGRAGPEAVPAPQRFAPDAVTREVQALVNARFVDHAGGCEDFGWPVTRADALTALSAFVAERLPQFGRWQDALWAGEPWLWHSHLSAALNVRLLQPREVVAAAEAACRRGDVPLASAEGFIRQILGWREYVRGIYWTRMPGYLERNALDAQTPLPAFYWNGATDMACLADAIGQTLRSGYAQHIQRLMVTGLYALLLGVRPQEVHAWYLSVYVDAVEWVELPNTLGMSQYGDAVRSGDETGGGAMASKPYVASGRYIERMSGGSLCARCRYRPAERIGARACPFTTLYWDFLLRHESWLAAHPRMVMQMKNLARLSADERARIGAQAAAHRAAVGA
jgi:deoxyribodipyrimidine photolyase-related protein